MKDPLFSMVLPNYNHADKLPRAFEGLFLQRYQNWEVVVADDASTDHSREVIEEYARKDERIRPLFSDKNRGVFGNLNFGLTAIRGDYFVSGAADDFFASPDYFYDAANSFLQFPQAGVFAGIAQMVSEGDLKKLYTFGHAPREGFYQGRDALGLYLADAIDMHGAASIARSDYAKRVGFDPKLGPTADCALFQSAAANHGLLFLKKIYINVTKSEHNFGKSITIHHHKLYEDKLKELVTYSAEVEEDFRVWRYNKIAYFLCISFQTDRMELSDPIAHVVQEIIHEYPRMVVEMSRKEAITSLAQRLRGMIVDPGLRAQVPNMVQLADTVIRPFYAPASAA